MIRGCPRRDVRPRNARACGPYPPGVWGAGWFRSRAAFERRPRYPPPAVWHRRIGWQVAAGDAGRLEEVAMRLRLSVNITPWERIARVVVASPERSKGCCCYGPHRRRSAERWRYCWYWPAWILYSLARWATAPCTTSSATCRPRCGGHHDATAAPTPPRQGTAQQPQRPR